MPLGGVFLKHRAMDGNYVAQRSGQARHADNKIEEIRNTGWGRWVFSRVWASSFIPVSRTRLGGKRKWRLSGGMTVGEFHENNYRGKFEAKTWNASEPYSSSSFLS
ncbi:hypothetical protein OsI_30501 [Oryza sativa Indica Group]|uniref:Uncharacterized protein n=1 Tax=Oryza sativa subsp. indica TaxID=39946 RepID=A2YYT4_ORYSI|nr:hypothetical protein OsI_30501 [Oryza sativa Indica Group]